MKTLREYLDEKNVEKTAPEEKFTPSGLSPVHLTTKDATEREMYNAVFKQFLEYYGRDETRAEYFGDLLYKFLVDRDAMPLKMHYANHHVLF